MTGSAQFAYVQRKMKLFKLPAKTITTFTRNASPSGLTIMRHVQCVDRTLKFVFIIHVITIMSFVFNKNLYFKFCFDFRLTRFSCCRLKHFSFFDIRVFHVAD